MSEQSAVSLAVSPEALRPFVESIIEQTLDRVERERAAMRAKMAFTEAEAAELLSLSVHQLRDVRLRGEITAHSVVGNRIRYTVDDLVSYLRGRKYVPKPKD